MARRKSLENMSAEELYALAREKEEAERAQADQSKEQIAELKAQRKELVREHAKALAAVDRELARLQGSRGKGTRSKGAGGRAKRGELPAKTLEAIAAKGPVSGRELKAQLSEQGLDVTYLAQCLAGLKKKGKITSPSRGVYQAA